MKNKLFAVLLCLLVMLVGCKKEKPVLTLATSSNMQFAMKELVTSFTSKTGYPCEAVVSSSGKLTAQIKEGAPFDLFFSADMKYPTELYNDGYTTGKPLVYARGKLVMWCMNRVPTARFLGSDYIKHIALANPRTAPFGKASLEVINHYRLYPYVKEKLVYGESISQVNQFVTTNSVDLGFTSMSVVLSSEMKDVGYWVEVDSAAYRPINQGMVALNNDKKLRKEVDAFVDFLFSKSGKKVLKDFGYLDK